MNLYEYLRSRSFSDIGPRHSDSTFANFFSLELTKPIEAKFHVDTPLDWGTKVYRKSMDSVDSLDFYHGLSGHLPQTQWTVWTMSMDTLDKVYLVR